jgi:hypothetical protein
MLRYPTDVIAIVIFLIHYGHRNEDDRQLYKRIKELTELFVI